MNTFSRENLKPLGTFDRVQTTIEVRVWSLPSLISNYPEVTKIDYMNIDAEGFESEIILGLADCQIRPSVVSVEQNGTFTLSDVLNSETCSLVKVGGYSPIAKNVILRDVATVFFRHQ